MKDNGGMNKQMDKENITDIEIKQLMKEIGLMISSKVKGRRLGKMDHLMKENIQMVKSKEKEFSSGAMATCILVISLTTKWMAMVCIIGRVERFMMDNGKKIEWKEKE